MRRLLALALILASAVAARAQAPPTPVQAVLGAAATTTCTAPGNAYAVMVNLPPSVGGVTFTIPTNAGANTVSFFGAADSTSATWVALNVTASNSTSAATSTTSTGTFQANVAGYSAVCVDISTFVSGTVSVTIRASTASARANGGGGQHGANLYVLSSNCAGYTNCVTTPANTIELTDGTITNTSPTISSVSYTFTVTDVGKKAYGFQDCQASNVFNRSVFIEGTIQSVNGHSATLSANATASQASTACIIFGNPDDTGWATLETNANASLSCPSFRLDGRGFMWTSWHFQTLNPAACANNESTAGQTIIGGGLDISGTGRGTSVIYLDPAISFTPCTLGASTISCMVLPANSDAHDFSFSGGGNSGAGNSTSKVLLEFGRYSELERMGFLNFGFQDSALIGTYVNQVFGGYGGLPVYLDSVDFDGWGSEILNIAAGKIIAKNSSWQDAQGQAQMIFNNDTFISLGGNHFFPMQPGRSGEAMILSNNGTTYLQPGDQCWQNASSNPYDCLVLEFASVAYVNGLDVQNNVNVNNLGIWLGQTSKAYVQNTILNTGGSSSVAVTLANSGTTYIDQGGNNYSGNPVSTVAGAQYVPYGPMNASCTGTATSSATLFIQWNVPNTASQACTSTSAFNFIAGHTGTLSTLIVSSGTGGFNASSGVVTVLDNAAATTLTCTLGTGTFCFDGTHYVAVTAGDLISVRVTTQATETLANLKILLSGY